MILFFDCPILYFAIFNRRIGEADISFDSKYSIKKLPNTQLLIYILSLQKIVANKNKPGIALAAINSTRRAQKPWGVQWC